jgi:ActR/RegA family two-component response regulator
MKQAMMLDKRIEKPRLILLETDSLAIARFTYAATRFYKVVSEQSAEDAVEAVIADPSVRMFVAGGRPGMSLAAIFGRVMMARPDVSRVALAEPNDLAAVIEGLHSGAIERTFNKPIDIHEVLAAIAQPSRLGTLSLASAAGATRCQAG